MYPDTNQDCQGCNIACEDCSGANADECSKCKQNFALLDGTTCTTDCGTGKWNNIDNKICTSCMEGCDDCTDATTCDLCSSSPDTYNKKVVLGATSCV